MAHDDPYAGKTVGATRAYNLSRAVAFTPTLTGSTTDPDTGADGEEKGTYHRNGHQIRDLIRIRFRGSGQSEGSGSYEVSPSHTIDLSLVEANNNTEETTVVGSGYVRNSSSSNITVVSVYIGSSGNLRMVAPGGTVIGNASPFNFASDGTILIEVSYTADSSTL